MAFFLGGQTIIRKYWERGICNGNFWNSLKHEDSDTEKQNKWSAQKAKWVT